MTDPGVERHHLEARDGTILSAVTYTPAGPPRGAVCLVHGLGEHSGRYGELASVLTGAGFAATGFDMRGHGTSPGRRGDAPSCTALISDVDVCLEASGERFPGLPQFLLGHSFGGSLVIGYAVGERPGRLAGAVALSPLLRPAVEPPRWKLTTAGILARLVPAFPMSTGVDPVALSRRAEVVADYRADPLVHGTVSARLGTDILEFGEECIRAAPGLETPMLLMHGSADRVTSPGASGEFASRAGEVCRLVVWEGLYHELHHEPERDDVASCMTGWMDERLEDG